ncbi:hypothetical protein [Nitrincola sp. A-D6]|uniref:hypothetical protein n=1 Tax=Nitrincola sp. A-D6 TaxID=1545442 RepID=UPI002E149D1C
MYLVVVYVPESHVDRLIESMSAAGAGQIGDYDQCAWRVLGQGQFRPWRGRVLILDRWGLWSECRNIEWKWYVKSQ